MWWVTSQKNGVSALGLQHVLGWGSYQTAWTCLHKLRRAMIRPGRERLTAVLLTGMGYDGSDAFTEIKKRGGRTIAESEESAVVYGMPAELVGKGGASLVLAAEQVAAQVASWAGR